ncbi:hypothetical protein ACWDGI_42890 [Streptomyces sp. NPDC001220]
MLPQALQSLRDAINSHVPERIAGCLTEEGPTHTTVSQVLDAPAERIFTVLRDARRHPELDATGRLRHAETSQPLTAVGDTFIMAMHSEEHGDYRIENRVVAFTENQVIGWAPGQPGQRPPGHRFTWKLTPTDGGRTEVTQIYDWAAVTHPAHLVRLPVVSADELDASLTRLAAAVAQLFSPRRLVTAITDL